MNWGGSLLWGFVGTVVLTSLLAVSQGLGLTRMNLPFMLGTMFTPDRDRAKVVGFGVHWRTAGGCAFVYAAAFQSWRRATWWLGAGIGLVHALFVLVAVMPLLPTLHPRMASEQRGPTPTRQLSRLGSWRCTTADGRRSRWSWLTCVRRDPGPVLSPQAVRPTAVGRRLCWSSTTRPTGTRGCRSPTSGHTRGGTASKEI